MTWKGMISSAIGVYADMLVPRSEKQHVKEMKT
jgi:hypothetical protein